jgi:steroid delta-isomerase-like uncharacterized protein
MTTENEEIVLRWWEELWNRGDLSLADEFHTSDFRDHDPASPWVQPGPDGMKEKVRAYRRAFPDLRFTMEKVLSADDHVVTHWKCTGTHQGEVLGLEPTGKAIEIEGISIFLLDDGRIAQQTLVGTPSACWPSSARFPGRADRL